MVEMPSNSKEFKLALKYHGISIKYLGDLHKIATTAYLKDLCIIEMIS